MGGGEYTFGKPWFYGAVLQTVVKPLTGKYLNLDSWGPRRTRGCCCGVCKRVVCNVPDDTAAILRTQIDHVRRGATQVYRVP